MSEKKTYGLFEINNKIRQTIEGGLPELFWVVAEISDLSVHFRSGHCYLDLIEKDEATDNIIAKSKATIWASAYRKIQAYFETTTGQALAPGIKVMIRVSIDYHEIYQLSLNVRDIDPGFTLGDLARQRQEIIRKLEASGTMDLNKSLDFPIVPQRIAIISSPTAAGYGDFIDQLENNGQGYLYYWDLFESSMQGKDTADSVLSALDLISERIDYYDVVIVIRGGGSKIDLAGFDNFDLGLYIAQFPIPVITGIGHERDETILDLVAHTRCKTPTAVAELLIDRTEEFEGWLDENGESAANIAREYVHSQQQKLSGLVVSLPLKITRILEETSRHLDISRQRSISAATIKVESQKGLLKQMNQTVQIQTRHFVQHLKFSHNNLYSRIVTNASFRLKEARQQIISTEEKASLHDPERLLKRGYSITYFNGKPIKDPGNLKPGDQISSRVEKGNIKSTVNEK